VAGGSSWPLVWCFEPRGPIITSGCPDVCYSHKADMAIGWQSPLLGVKRTSLRGAAMSAFDPKRTLTSRKLRNGIYGKSGWPYSGFMLAVRITSAHFSVLSAINLPKSVGEPVSAVPPRSAIRAFILGSATAALISLLSVSMILAGVFLGAPMPDQALASYPGRNSPTVGR